MFRWYMFMYFCVCCFFFFKQKTAYEMRISDWSSDVCSSDLLQSVHVDEQRFVGDVVFAMRGIFAHVERIVETVIPQLGNAVVGQLCIRQQRRDDPVRLHIAAQARDLLAECAVRMAPVIVELLFRN